MSCLGLRFGGRVTQRGGLCGGVRGGVSEGVCAKCRVGGHGAGVDVCFDLADGGYEVSLGMRVEEAEEASVPSSGGAGGGGRWFIPGADERGVVSVDDGGPLKNLNNATEGGPLGGA